MIFEHTSKERDMWRGWLKNGQSLELHRSRTGWDFQVGVLVHSNDDDLGDRMMCLKFWRWSAYIPLGITTYQVDINHQPKWSVSASDEFGLSLDFGINRKSFDWPWSVRTLRYECQMDDGSWSSVFNSESPPYSESHPYSYALKSGEIQERTATISKRRHVLTRVVFHRFGWPKWVSESIEIEFSDEVGERSGSWKGGCIGCGYDLKAGETLLECLRRMERDRKF